VTLDDLAEMGIEVRADGDRLVLRPQERVTEELIAKVKGCKPALLLEARIRAMGAWWGYTAEELGHALRLAAADPEPWRDLVADDERWRAANADRRPTSALGHG
jgi:hypothetical protein